MSENKININLPAENFKEAETAASVLSEMNLGEQQALRNYIRAFQDGINYARNSNGQDTKTA